MSVENFLRCGDLELGSLGVTLSNGSRLQEICKVIPKGKRLEEYETGKGHTFILLDNLFGTEVALTLLFRKGELKMMFLQPLFGLQVVRPESMKEMKDYAYGCRQWFFDKTGIELPAKFDWGEIEIIISARNLETPIVISYA